MILVLASRFDAAAKKMVERWDDDGVRLATCEALSGPGWRWQLDRPADATIGIDGVAVPTGSITKVLCLLPCVTPAELPQIAEAEQQYVADELMACLLAWLHSLGPRMLNPPSPLCLTGPHLHPEQWLQHAVAAGLTIRPQHRRSQRFVPCGHALDEGTRPTSNPIGEPDHPPPWFGVPVVAGRVVGEVPAELGGSAAGIEQLAATTGAVLLTAMFACMGAVDPVFTGAAPTVDVARQDVAAALALELGLAP